MTSNPCDEQHFLESLTHTYVTSDSPQDRAIKEMALRVFAPFLCTSMHALEMGCCDGYMTSLIAPRVASLDVVDGSTTWLETARARNLRGTRFFLSLFEDYVADRRYDVVFATYVLEHVSDPQQFLGRVRALLNPDGLLLLVVPNARALSRQLARHMGLLPDLHSLTANDLNHGHRRVYDRVSLNRELETAGFRQITQGGLMLKILADFQMDQLIQSGVLGEAQLDGLYKLGLEYPDLCGALFSVARPT
jgi:2-polyprenyl-3-methyl-5-hydroxy-6-metoxy-1,4-benzoquinol methylase